MKKVILLLLVFCTYHVVFSQSIATSDNLESTMNVTQNSHQDRAYTPLDKKVLMSSYLKLGKAHYQSGHLDEASSFFEKAFSLAKEYYFSPHSERSPVKLMINDWQFLQTFFTLALASEKKSKTIDKAAVDFDCLSTNVDSMESVLYLQQAEQCWAEQSGKMPKASPYRENMPSVSASYSSTNSIVTDNKSLEQKVVASFFMAVTEPVEFDVYSLSKKTSLRQAATHRSKSLKRLATDTKVIVLEKTNKYWWKVETNGTSGYVKALLLNLADSI